MNYRPAQHGNVFLQCGLIDFLNIYKSETYNTKI